MIKCLILGAGPFHVRRPNTHEETLVDRLPFRGKGNTPIDVVHNLDYTPWPFEDNNYDEIVAIHLVEHLKDLISFMNECWRILRPGGALYLATPEAGNNFNLTHTDPTHVRTYRVHTWINYFTRSEGPKFGYTDKFWALWDIRVVEGSIHLHAMPLKKEEFEDGESVDSDSV